MGYVNHDMLKHHKEIRRKERREAKAAKLALRRAERLQGVPIDDLPEDIQGLARALSHGGHDAA